MQITDGLVTSTENGDDQRRLRGGQEQEALCHLAYLRVD
jgi:hypothetical protein